MVLVANPEESLDQFEHIEFQDLFSDINSPGIFIVKNKSDKKLKLIILDGHSTLLAYTQGNDTPWSTYNNPGQYKYQPEAIGDGLSIFPNVFYFEFDLYLSIQHWKVNATFDATGIQAITTTLSDNPLKKLAEKLKDNFSDIISSVLKEEYNQNDIKIGLQLKIPKNILDLINSKLAFMGIKLEKLVPMIIVDSGKTQGKRKEKKQEEHPIKMKEWVKHEEKKKPKRKRVKKKKSKPIPKAILKSSDTKTKESAPPVKFLSVEKENELPSKQIPTLAATPAPAAPPAKKPRYEEFEDASGPPATKTRVAPPPSKRKKAKASHSEIPSAPPPKAKKTSVTLKEKEVPFELHEEYMLDDLAVEEEAEEDEPDSSIEEISVEESVTMRHTHASYFDRMIPNRAYPLLVKISTEELKIEKSVSSIISGERLSEKKDTLIVSDKTPILTIKPEFPGCFIVPSEIEVDTSIDNIEALFHITPIAFGKLSASIIFIQDRKVIHKMSLETKVITHRLSRIAAWIGAAASTIPAILAFILNENPKEFMTKRLDTFAPSLSKFGLIIPGIITSIFLGGSVILYFFQRPSRKVRSVTFPG